MENSRIIIVNSGIVILIEKVVSNKLVDSFLSKIRVDSGSAIAKQCCKVMNFSRLAAFEDNSKGCSLLCNNKVLMKC